MPAPDSTTEEIRTSTLLYLRMYEEGKLTLSDLATELVVMTAAYRHAIGSVDDEFARLLEAALNLKSEEQRHGWSDQHEFEEAVTEFRRAAAAWE